MLKNERLVRLHVRFEKHFEAHSTDTGGDFFLNRPLGMLLWDGKWLVQNASMTLRLH